MRCVIQKAKDAKCIVNKKIVSEIDFGLMVLVGFTETDSEKEIKWMAKKIANLRIFDDDNHIMNKSVIDIKGKILAISQFTLYGDASKGNRPSYIKALNGDKALPLYNEFCKELNNYVETLEGVFGGDMNIEFTNVGPTTITIER